MRQTVLYMEGDGIGPEVVAAARPVIDAAVAKAYGSDFRLEWQELQAGEKALKETGELLPQASLEALRTASFALKGPLGTPVGKGFRSLNVTLRQSLDLYACIRPVRWFPGVASPVRHPEKVDMVIFRENTEDLYLGIEYKSGAPETVKLLEYLRDALGVSLPAESAVGLKPMTPAGSKRLIRRAVRFALDHKKPSVTFMHKGNIMKFTEGGFRQWGYDLVDDEFAGQCRLEADPASDKLLIKDRIADALFQEVLLHPEEYSVIAAPNLNGDYISDAVAAQVGGLGMAPGVNMSDSLAFYEATHGTAPAIAGKDKANPCSVVLCGAMMLEEMGRGEAARLINAAVEKVVAAKTVTQDLAGQMQGAKAVGCKAFGDLLGAAL